MNKFAIITLSVVVSNLLVLIGYLMGMAHLLDELKINRFGANAQGVVASAADVTGILSDYNELKSLSSDLNFTFGVGFFVLIMYICFRSRKNIGATGILANKASPSESGEGRSVSTL